MRQAPARDGQGLAMCENGRLTSHAENHNIKAKLRQQLQMLRDRGVIEFLGNGLYRRII